MLENSDEKIVLKHTVSYILRVEIPKKIDSALNDGTRKLITSGRSKKVILGISAYKDTKYSGEGQIFYKFGL